MNAFSSNLHTFFLDDIGWQKGSNAETTYMPNGAHFPGHTKESGLLFGYAPDACMTPPGLSFGTWRLLRNCKDLAAGSASAAQVDISLPTVRPPVRKHKIITLRRCAKSTVLL